MFNRNTYFNSRGDGHPVLEIIPPAPAEGEAFSIPRLFVPLRHSHLTGTITGSLADLSLKQSFRFDSEENPSIVEAVYRFPLPGDGAVTGVKVCFGEVEISTTLKARQEADKEYAEARQSGKQAILLTRETPDVFSLAVHGIKPGETVEIETSFLQITRSENPGWSLRIPLTTAPRYVRRDESGQRQANGQPLMLLRDPGHRFSMQIDIEGYYDVTAGSVALETVHTGNHTTVRLANSPILPDRDLLLQWQARESSEQPELHVLSWQDPEDSMAYFIASVQTPAAPANKGIPREIILLVDHSGSMSGAKWAAADWAVKSFLNQLQEDDLFTLGVFHDYTTWWSDHPRLASSSNVSQAAVFLDENRNSGGTELGVALEQALSMTRTGGKVTRHVLLITDAEVTDSGRILALTDSEQEQDLQRRISVLCIDSAPNALLANEIADRSGGISCFLTSNPNEEDISSALDNILEAFTRPVYADAILEVESSGLEASRQAILESSESGWSAIDIGDIRSASRQIVCGRFPGQNRKQVNFELNATGLKVPLKMVCDLHDTPGGSPAFKALFGAGRLLILEQLQSFGLDRNEIEKILKRLNYNLDRLIEGTAGKKKRYAENQGQELIKALRELLVNESLRYGLLCSETAFTAIRSEAGARAEYTVAVPGAWPEGWEIPGHFRSMARAGGGSGARPLMASPMSAPPGPAQHVNNVIQKKFDFFAGSIAMPNARRPVPNRNACAPPPSLLREEMSESSFNPRHAGSPAPPSAAPGRRSLSRGELLVFSGIVRLKNGEIIMFDSGQDITRPDGWEELPGKLVFKGLSLEFQGKAPEPRTLDRRTSILLYCGDEQVPASRIRLSDLIHQSGRRPLNISWSKGQLLKLLLEDPSGQMEGVEITIRLEW